MKTNPEIIYIKNMVCDRCILVVRERMLSLGIEPVSVELGIVTLPDAPAPEQREAIRRTLEEVGFEVIDDKRLRLIEQIKNAIIELVHTANGDLKFTLSGFLSEKVNYEYSYISNLFSEIENSTIEHYFILQKIERVKELLLYDELSLSEIGDLLHYSSTAHLSAQFKKVTGITPSQFKKSQQKGRRPLDRVK